MEVQPVDHLWRDFDYANATVVGKGGMGHVSKIMRKSDNKIFALKSTQKGWCKKGNVNIKREKLALECLDHPNIVKLFNVFEDDRDVHLVIDWCKEMDLHSWIDIYIKEGIIGLPEASCQYYTAELTSALEHLRQLGFVHRDIKCENIIMTGDFHIKLTDFGTAKPITNGAGGVVQDLNSYVGTSRYMAPEVKLNKRVTYSTDLWGIAAVTSMMFFAKWVCKRRDGEHWDYYYPRIDKRRFRFPTWRQCPLELSDFIYRLTRKKACLRLGATSFDELKRHKYLSGINWDTLHQTPAPPLTPIAGDKHLTAAHPPGHAVSPIKRFTQPKDDAKLYQDSSIFNSPHDVYHRGRAPPPDDAPAGSTTPPPRERSLSSLRVMDEQRETLGGLGSGRGRGYGSMEPRSLQRMMDRAGPGDERSIFPNPEGRPDLEVHTSQTSLLSGGRERSRTYHFDEDGWEQTEREERQNEDEAPLSGCCPC